jgi:hypothetical protein
MGRERQTMSFSTSFNARACPSVKVKPKEASTSATEGREGVGVEEGGEGGEEASSGRQGGRVVASRSA